MADWVYGCSYTQDYADEPCGMVCVDFREGDGGVIVDVDDAHESAEPNILYPCPACNTDRYLEQTAEIWEEQFFQIHGRWPTQAEADERRQDVKRKFSAQEDASC